MKDFSTISNKSMATGSRERIKSSFPYNMKEFLADKEAGITDAMQGDK